MGDRRKRKRIRLDTTADDERMLDRLAPMYPLATPSAIAREAMRRGFALLWDEHTTARFNRTLKRALGGKR